MKKDGIYLSQQELKDLVFMKKKKRKSKKKKRKYFQDNRTPGRGVQGIRSSSDHMQQGFGTQINRSNDLANELARQVIDKEERIKEERAKRATDETALVPIHPTHPATFRDEEAHESLGYIFNALKSAEHHIENRFKAIENPSFRDTFVQNNNLSRDEPVVHEEPVLEAEEDDDDDEQSKQENEDEEEGNTQGYESPPIKLNSDLEFMRNLRHINDEHPPMSIRSLTHDNENLKSSKKQKMKEGSKSSLKDALEELNTVISSSKKSLKSKKVEEPKEEEPEEEPEKRVRTKKTIKGGIKRNVDLSLADLVNNSIKPRGNAGKGFVENEWKTALGHKANELIQNYQVKKTDIKRMTQSELATLYKKMTGKNIYADL